VEDKYASIERVEIGNQDASDAVWYTAHRQSFGFRFSNRCDGQRAGGRVEGGLKSFDYSTLGRMKDHR
jgi:hypothetical protein